MSVSKQQPTLFSFFTKTPKPTTPRSTAKSSPAAKEKLEDEKTDVIIIKGNEIKALHLVWAKLEGYPWWPALVYEHPVEKTIYRKKHKQIHVQFFDDPPTRGWVKESFVKPYKPRSEVGVPTYKDPQWIKAKAEADQIVSLPIQERSSLIVEMVPSDNSSDEESFLDDSETSKENVDENIKNGKRRSKSEEEEEKGAPKAKKRRIVLLPEESESEDEYIPDKDKNCSDDDDSASSGVDEAMVSESVETETESEAWTPVKETKKRNTSSSTNSKAKKNISFAPKGNNNNNNKTTPIASSRGITLSHSPAVSSATKSKLSLFTAKETPTKPSSKEEGDWPHTTLSWLRPENIRDRQGHPKDHPDYSPRTVRVPDEFLSKQTPAMRQWWELKSVNYDTVLFFKMGKFYELFHMDAILSIQELGLLMMKGDQAHTGFPEIAYGRYSSVLIERGYKVSRVEQVETPDMMEKRCKNIVRPTKFDKVVKRELCQVTSLGTRVPSVIDADATSSQHSFLLAVTERLLDGPGEARCVGVCFLDTSIGTFHVGQFHDDRHISRLRTLLSHYPPAQILIERGQLSAKTLKFLKAVVPAGLLECLVPEKEFWSSSKTLSYLAEGEFFKEEKSRKLEWPESVKELLDEGDTLGLTPKEKYELGVSCLGGVIWYLKVCKLEENLLSRRMFTVYTPIDHLGGGGGVGEEEQQVLVAGRRRRMIIDGTTLRNLEVFENSANGSSEGSLFETINHCCTPFGKRLLHCWLCSPLCNKSGIDGRLDAVDDLREHPEVVDEVKPLLKGLPDLEKLLSKIHSMGMKHSSDHPENRAIYYESKQYSQRKVADFLAVVNGFKDAMKVVKAFKGICCDLKSELLKNCVTCVEEGGKFHSLHKILKFFDNAFDHAVAKKEGKITPSEGVDAEYDQAVSKIEHTNRALEKYLQEQGRYFAAKVTYWGNDKRRFQIEVPDHAAKNADDDYELVSQKKGFKRYWTEETKGFLRDIISAEEERENALQDIARRIFQQFDEHYKKWASAVECISVLDVLLSLTQYSLQTDTVRPVVEMPSREERPFIHIREGRHPCSIKIFSGGDYIPNDLIMNEEGAHSPLILVTGPNMGGKSTLMRQTALLCLMAQLGSYVPASECRLSVVDRIFTRLGAWDRIFQGESTFYVELAETAAIMQHATHNSLVIVDELGRGTSTYDGTAIAYAVVNALMKVKCRTLFSTHYHSLVDEFRDSEGVSLGHMACMVENDNDDDPSQETITFLYKFASGACPKSYGFNAARLADLPESVIRSASSKAKELEITNRKKKSFRHLFADMSTKNCVKDIVIELKKFI